MKLDKVTEIVVATATDDDGNQLSETELRIEVVDPVNGPFAGAYRFVHDRSVAPRGKVVAARIGRDESEVLAYHTAAPYKSSGQIIILADGTRLNEEVCTEDSRPLLGISTTQAYRIHVNPMDFGCKADFDAFVSEIESQTKRVEVTASPRKGLGAEVLVTLVLAKIGETPEDRVEETTAEDVAGSLRGVWMAWMDSLKRHTRKGADIGQNIIISEYDPAVELHFRDDDGNAIQEAFDVLSLRETLFRAGEAKKSAGAVRVHFKWMNRSWRLHYLQTSDGQQWLTEYAQKERQRKEEALEQSLEQNGLTGGGGRRSG